MERGIIRLVCALVLLTIPIMSTSSSDGNRLLPGTLILNETEVKRVQLPAVPRWIVGHPNSDRDVWYVLLDDARIVKVTMPPGGEPTVGDTGRRMPNRAELSLKRGPDGSFDLFTKDEYFSNFANRPVAITADTIAAVDREGIVHIRSGENYHRLKETFLYDGRIVTNRRGEVLLLHSGSTVYHRGILGDEVEPAGFTIRNLQTPEVPGKLIASSKPIGKEFRWIHLLAAGVFDTSDRLPQCGYRAGGRFRRRWKRRVSPCRAVMELRPVPPEDCCIFSIEWQVVNSGVKFSG